jgi:hypothetical protein
MREVETLCWTGVEALADLRERLRWALVCQQEQQRVADERQIGQEMGMTAARAVCSHDGIAPPMVAYCHTAPVSANQFQPLGRCVLVRRCAGKIGARFGGGQAGFFDRARATQDDQGSGEGEVGRQGFDGEGRERRVSIRPWPDWV